MRNFYFSLSILALLLILVRMDEATKPSKSLDAAEPVQTKAKLTYNKDIRPILSENCFACHGPDSAARKGDLRLDLREEAIAKGAIQPGKPEKSEALARIMLPESDEGMMPPKKTHKKLTPAQKAIIKQWIIEGAEYEPHWSFIPPTKPSVPKVKNKEWVRNPIDAFILSDLEAQGLTPAPEADRRTLARRLSLDLVGLPPTIEEVEEFVNDKSADYYEKYVERLMKSVHWGEHRARYWLDAARYADTHGIHFDNFRENWSYREWVIRAFNQNMKFDQFTTEQLAGDLLPNPTLDQKVATGFNRCNITTSEGGAIAEEYLVLYTRDRTETMSQVYLGLTTGCAVCHNHKFDPITQKDFYSLAAFFNNTTQNAMDGNVHNTPPVIPVPRLEDRAEYDAILKAMDETRSLTKTRKTAAKSDFESWLKKAKVETLFKDSLEEKLTFHAKLNESQGKSIAVIQNGETKKIDLPGGYTWSAAKENHIGLQVKADGELLTFPDVGDFDVSNAFTISTWVKNAKRNQSGAIISRMDTNAKKNRGWDLYLQGDKLAFHLINAYPQSALKVVSKNQIPFNKWHQITVSYDGSAKASGVKIYVDGEPQAVTVENDTLKDSTHTTAPFRIGARSDGPRVTNTAISDLRLYSRELTSVQVYQLAEQTKILEIMKKAPAKRSAADVDVLFNFWLSVFDKEYQSILAKERSLVQKEAAIHSRGTIAHISVEKPTPPEAYILIRGDYDKRGEKVGPDTPTSLPKFDPSLPRNRLGLAKWVLSKENPLTNRVTVNRFWQELFGVGLVRTSGDFGISGELPSHPALLDWLAEDFESDWDMKRFFKLLVTSATYRQAAVTTADKLEKDPQNRLLSRGPRFRMDAEMIRDYALATSGLLVRKIGGPSVKPYQPIGVWEAVAMIGSNTRNYTQDRGENLYRRSMYTFWKRAAPPASMELFNAPNRETCAVKRERTNTPIQALVTLNDIQFVEAARNLAELTIKSSAKQDDRIQFIAKRLLARPFNDRELSIVRASANELIEAYKGKADDAKKLISVGESKADEKLEPTELAAWTMLCNQLLNLDEVLNK